MICIPKLVLEIRDISLLVLLLLPRLDDISNYGYLFGTATYVDYLTFSHLNTITNPTPLPNATQTIGATARNPNYWGSRVYPNYRGSRTQA